MNQKPLKIAGYCRLSRDDENIGESGSISNQKEIIRQYCEKNGMTVLEYYADDGWTGTNFERPEFQRMIEDIESGRINCVITKDLSRLGRDYIMTGYYTEVYFPENGVRYIAINDGFDTKNGFSSNNDIAPFKNLMNDMYAKDISKKIRSAKHAKAVNGKGGKTYAPIGYRKDPDDKFHLLIDEETAWIVRKIFDLYMSGLGVRQIRDYLEDNKVINPSALLHIRRERYYPELRYDEDESLRYRWSSDMVGRVLHNEVYIGNSVHYRNIKPTNKSKSRRNSKENYMIIENTHEPIIDKETFYEVQVKMTQHRGFGSSHGNILKGIVKCYDCHAAMDLNYKEYHGKNGTTARQYMTCNRYIKYGKTACTCHHVKFEPLCKALAMAINDTIKSVQIDRDAVEKRLLNQLKKQISTDGKAAMKRLAAIERRLNDLNRLLMKLFEDRTLGVLSDDNYRMFAEKYQKEQSDLNGERTTLRAETEKEIQIEQDVRAFIDMCTEALPVTELTDEIAHKFIDTVYVHEGEKIGKRKEMEIDIYFKFVGNAPFFG